MNPSDSEHSNPGTVVAVAIVAYIADDLIHEVLGPGVAAGLTGVPILSLSTVALQTGTSNRLVASAGTIANAAAGMLALGLFTRGKELSIWRYF